MGAGRKTETYTLAPDGYPYGTMCVRNLKKGDLCAVIFGCKFSTIKECYAKKLFGLPSPHMAYIKNIDPGLTLFLFNYSDRTLHGIFESASEGKLNIDPKAWSPNGTDPSPYPAQVRVRVRVQCEPLLEEQFGPIIAENYKDEKMFWFELDRVQTNKLLRLFKPSPSVRGPSISSNAAPPSRKPIPASSLAEIGELGAPHVDKWSSLFKTSDGSSENKGKDSKDGGAVSNVVNLGKTKEWEAAANNADVRNAQPSVSQSGSSYSSVLKNMTAPSTQEKKTSLTNEVPSQAGKGVANNWSSAYHQQILHPTQKGTSATVNNVIGPSKKAFTEDTCSEIDWDAASNFKVHLEGLNRILDDPGANNNGFKRFDGNTGFASSSSMVPNHWEDEEVNVDKSPCGSSYVSAMTGDTLDDLGDDKEKQQRMDNFNLEMGSTTFVDILNEILSEVKELKLTQMKQAEYMISLEMDQLESRKEILRLKARNGSS
ncbi:unnamed protein product [Arabis nemorensis]|uniref:DCD domain-containing protein n=1 Tax=Arabis nemorensis TaxID=586526 RepID=A0A565B6B4_9BRAS|nr:unnamed protein product [Arabis nemorensis]